jgi:hypothetical protein
MNISPDSPAVSTQQNPVHPPAARTTVESRVRRPELRQAHPSHPAVSGVDSTLYLLGRPSLQQFLRFARRHGYHPPSDRELADMWRAARDVLRTLETEEAGFADNPTVEKIDVRKHEDLLVEFLKDPLVQNGFNTVPSEVAYVELDRLVVSQHHIDLTYSRQLASVLGPSPTGEQVLKTALLHEHPEAPVKSSSFHRNGFVIMSPSNDIRFLSTVRLQPENIKGFTLSGRVAGVFGAAIGFGSNFMNVISTGKRLILNNGYHRAYTLRSVGVTHAPCIVQHALSAEELDAVASSEVTERPEYYNTNPRPTVLKDYFDQRLHVVMNTHRRLKQITVKIEVSDAYVPSF